MLKLNGGVIAESEEVALTVINERLRDDYIEDCEKGIARWNRTIRENGIDFTLSRDYNWNKMSYQKLDLYACMGRYFGPPPAGKVGSQRERAQTRRKLIVNIGPGRHKHSRGGELVVPDSKQQRREAASRSCVYVRPRLE